MAKVTRRKRKPGLTTRAGPVTVTRVDGSVDTQPPLNRKDGDRLVNSATRRAKAEAAKRAAALLHPIPPGRTRAE